MDDIVCTCLIFQTNMQTNLLVHTIQFPSQLFSQIALISNTPPIRNVVCQPTLSTFIFFCLYSCPKQMADFLSDCDCHCCCCQSHTYFLSSLPLLLHLELDFVPLFGKLISENQFLFQSAFVSKKTNDVVFR